MKKILIIIWLILFSTLAFGQSYDNYPPTPDKVLQPDGSIVSIISAETIAPPDATRAQQYNRMPLQAAKYLLPDGTIINGVPIITAISGTPTTGYCVTVNSSGALVYAACGAGSMTWPSGGAGIPNYSGSSSWGTSYSFSVDTSLGTSDTTISSQKAVKSYIDTGLGTKQNTLTNPITGTSTNHYWGYFTGATTLGGKSITASKPVCSDASGDPGVCAGTEGVWQVAGSYAPLISPALTGTPTINGIKTGWQLIPAASYTATPASTSTLTMVADLTASIKVGMSIQVTIGGVVYYDQVTAIASNLLTIRGPPLSGDVTNLMYGGGQVRQVNIIIPGTYEDASNTALITSDLKSSFIWALPTSYCVGYKVYSNTHDTGTHGQASVRINGTEVNTTAGGLTIAADQTWYNTVVDIATAAYDINTTEALEITAVKNGNGDAADLTVEIIFVTP